MKLAMQPKQQAPEKSTSASDRTKNTLEWNVLNRSGMIKVTHLALAGYSTKWDGNRFCATVF